MEESVKKHYKGKIVLIVLAALLGFLIGALVFAGNYLFNFALDPQAEGMLHSYDAGEWELTGKEAWLDKNSEDRWLVSRDGLSLHGLYLTQKEQSHKYAVICHGYGGFPQGMGGFAAHFYDMGYNILTPAARSHELSEGRYASMGWLERKDIVDWVGTLVEQDPEAQIILFGVSMGGATVMMTAGEELPGNVKCVIEDCGYSSVWDEFAGQLQELFGLPTFPVLDAASLTARVRAGFSFKEASSVEQLKRATVPMLFIHGEDDTFVPYWMLDVVYEACASPEKERLSIPGAAHAEAAGTDPELYWSTVAAFLEKHVK